MTPSDVKIVADNINDFIEVPDGISRLRKAVLTLAVSGQLVEQNENEGTADELYAQLKAEHDKIEETSRKKKTKKLHPISDEEVPFNIPKSWKWVRLGDVTNYGSTDKSKPSDLREGVWVLELEDLEKNGGRLLSVVRYPARLSLSDKNVFKRNDVLYGKLRPYLNKVIVAMEDGVSSSELLPIRWSADPEFLRLVLLSDYFSSYVNSITYGVKMPRLGTEDGRNALFPLAPLSEQERIVKRVNEVMKQLDELESQKNERDLVRSRLTQSAMQALGSGDSNIAFAQLTELIKTTSDIDELESQKNERDLIRSRLTQSAMQALGSVDSKIAFEQLVELIKTPQDIKELENAILTLAVSGKLVPQVENEGTGTDLYQKISATLIKPKKSKEIDAEDKLFNIPLSWIWTRLGDVFDVRDGTHDSPKYKDSGYPLVTSKNLYHGRLDFLNVKYVSETDHKKISERSKVDRDDILFAMIGSIGNPVIVDTDIEFSIKNVALFKYFDRKLTEPNFLLIYLKYASVNMRKVSAGGVQSFVSLGFLRQYPFPLPPLAEQKRIVKKVEELMYLLERLKNTIKVSLS